MSSTRYLELQGQSSERHYRIEIGSSGVGQRSTVLRRYFGTRRQIHAPYLLRFRGPGLTGILLDMVLPPISFSSISGRLSEVTTRYSSGSKRKRQSQFENSCFAHIDLLAGGDYLLIQIFCGDMPFRGRLDGQPVVPAIVDDGEAVTCPVCGDTMYPRSAPGKARHFYHVSDAAGQQCSSGGESETHVKRSHKLTSG